MSRVDENKCGLIFNNCEHSANWCTHDDDYSVQADGNVENMARHGFSPGISVLPDALSVLKTIKDIKKFFTRKKHW